ncbi:iron-sulfur cluster insertion protein ErpA [bacterium]|nr:iron-sulfur cluster insertion protein ErpA [bacterium]
MPDTVTPERALAISDSAARRIAVLIQQDGRPNLMLRLSVSGGGCSGFQYGFTFDDATTADDHTFEHQGVKLVTDDCSLDLLSGATLDYVEDLMGSAFQVRNPNATASCGCG